MVESRPAGTHPAVTWPRTAACVPRGGPRSLRSRSTRRFSAFRAKSGLQALTGPGGESTCLAPENCTSPQVPFATTSKEACRRNAEERKTTRRQGRPGPVSPTKSPLAMQPRSGGCGPGGERGLGPGHWVRPPGCAPYP